MTRARNGAADDYQLDREFGDGPEPGDQFGSAPMPLDEPHRAPNPGQSRASRRAAGRVQVAVWLSAEQVRRLRWIRDEDGHDNAQIIGGHIDAEYEERMGIEPVAKHDG